MLKFVLLYFIPEEIGINSPDEREVILSEIYRRFHPEEEDLFEMEIQGEISRDVAKAWFSLPSHADVLRLVTRSSPRTSAQRTGHIRSLAVSQS